MIPRLLDECSEFLIDSNGKSLIKNLPKIYEGFKRVKVRKKKRIAGNFVNSFNNSFSSYNDLLNRAVFVNTNEKCDDDKEPFYIFPINGYKIMYNSQINNIRCHYESFFVKLNSWLDEKDSNKVFTDIIKNHFQTNDIELAINAKSDIIIYGINYYYAIRKTLIDDYKKFIYDL